MVKVYARFLCITCRIGLLLYIYTPNKISHWSLFKLIFPHDFLPIYVCFNRQMFSGVSKNLSINPQLFG